MGERRRTTEIYRGRATRRIGGITALATGAVALVMLLSPLTTATTAAAFKGSVGSPNLYASSNGCGSVKAASPKWSALTGVVRMAGTAIAKACVRSLNGVGASSSASAGLGEQVEVPMKIPGSSTGINVTWKLTGTWMDKATGYSLTGCPSYKYNYSYYYSYYSSYVNYTYTNSYCSLSASVSLYGYASLTDMTTGATYYSSTYWSGFNRGFDRSNSTSTTVENWSNPNYWANNYTSSYSNGYMSGLSGAGTFSPMNNPTWWFNGTFSGKHKYVLSVSLTGNVNVYSNGLGKLAGTAALDLSTGTNGAALVVVVY